MSARQSGTLALGCALGLAGCSGKSEDSGASAERPDPTGSYNVVVLGTAGCEGEQSWVAAWAPGPLKVEASGASVGLNFGEDAVLDGDLDVDGVVRSGGAWTQAGASLEVSVDGTFTLSEAGWQLEGDIAVVVDDGGAETCTVDAPFVADELQAVEERR